MFKTYDVLLSTMPHEIVGSSDLFFFPSTEKILFLYQSRPLSLLNQIKKLVIPTQLPFRSPLFNNLYQGQVTDHDRSLCEVTLI